MMRIEKDQGAGRLVPLERVSLAQGEYKEVAHLQKMILDCDEAFFNEIGEDLLVVGSECMPRPDACKDRVDILALDRTGTAVVVELKRGHDKLQLLQALTYAAMLRVWTLDDFVAVRSAFVAREPEGTADEVAEFLSSAVESVNANQRVLLVAEEFDFQVLATAEWLSEAHGVAIKCVRIVLSADGGSHYLSAQTIFPTSSLYEHSWQGAKPKPGAEIPATSWDGVCEQIADPNLEALARSLAATLPAKDVSPAQQGLYFRAGGKRVLELFFRRKRAYVWASRFADDQEFWVDALGPDIGAQELQGGKALRFYLRSIDECDRFKSALSKLASKHVAN